MASFPSLSSSVRKGQIALMCQLCENDPKLTWKCLDCQLMMCQRCRDKVHPKFPSAEVHTVINIKEMGKHKTGPEPKLDFTQLKCEVHTGKNCCMFCNTCQVLVCQTCIAKTHNTHNFGEINDEYQTKLEKVKRRGEKIKARMQSLIKCELKLKQIKLTEQSNYEKVKQEILDYDKALINKIKKHTDTLLKELDQRKDAVSNVLKDEWEKLEVQRGQILKQNHKINQLLVLHPDNVSDVLSRCDSLLASVETEVTTGHTSFHGIPKFKPGHQTQFQLLLGQLEDVTIQYSTELQIEAKFETELESVTSVVSRSGGLLWISDCATCILQKVKPNADNLSVESNFKLKVLHAARLPSEELLLCVYGSSTLKLISSGSTEIHDSVYTTSPIYPSAVHVTFDNKVMVGAIAGKSIFPADGPRQVIVMDQTGHQEKVFQYDRHNKPLFTAPYHLSRNRRATIAVKDTISDDHKGRIVLLDHEGSVKSIYTGHPGVNNEDNPFKPGDITTTPSDNFVVVDSENNTLHILNNEGEIIKFYNTEEIGIVGAWSLSFSSTGKLYIGCVTDEDSKEKANLFRINNILC